MRCHRCSECGRPAVCRPFVGRYRSRKARAGRRYAIKDHDLCAGCHERLWDSERARRMAAGR